jgi:hypothetical protein
MHEPASAQFRSLEAASHIITAHLHLVSTREPRVHTEQVSCTIPSGIWLTRVKA